MTDELQVRSYGAAMTVTGSCHLVATGSVNVLVDCGAFQGSTALSALNREPFGFDPQAIDAVLLTHAHMDHAARLPLLVRRGYTGLIHALPATKLLAQHLATSVRAWVAKAAAKLFANQDIATMQVRG